MEGEIERYHVCRQPGCSVGRVAGGAACVLDGGVTPIMIKPSTRWAAGLQGLRW